MSNKVVEAVLKISSRMGSMKALDETARKMAIIDQKAKAYNRTNNAMMRGMNEMNVIALRYAAPAVIAAGTAAAVQSYASLERRMTRMGITADESAEQTKAAFSKIRKIAQEVMVPVDEVATGFESLLASGKSLDEAMALLPTISKTAHAAGADFGAVATTADSVMGSLKISAQEAERAFDIMFKAGNEGKFEMRDMAAELPSLAPQFAAMGYTGEEGLRHLVAILQGIRKETGSSAEAATQAGEVFSKMGSETVSNNFKKFGINIRAEMKLAKAAGEDVVQAFIRLSKEAIGGDMSLLPQLFTDKEMQNGMRGLINSAATMNAIFIGTATAVGTIDRANAKLATNTEARIQKMKNNLTILTESIGGFAAIPFNYVADGIINMADKEESAFAAGKAIGLSPYQIKKNQFFDPEGFSRLAFDGGCRSNEVNPDGQNIAKLMEQGRRELSPETMKGADYDALIGGVYGGPLPVPTSRPDRNGSQFPDLRMPAGAPYVPAPSGPISLRPEQSNADLSGLLANLENAEIAAPDVVQGGSMIEDAGRVFQSAVSQMSSIVGKLAEAIGGLKAAAAGGQGPNRGVNADVGRETSDPGGRFGGPR